MHSTEIFFPWATVDPTVKLDTLPIVTSGTMHEARHFGNVWDHFPSAWMRLIWNEKWILQPTKNQIVRENQWIIWESLNMKAILQQLWKAFCCWFDYFLDAPKVRSTLRNWSFPLIEYVSRYFLKGWISLLEIGIIQLANRIANCKIVLQKFQKKNPFKKVSLNCS
jgi:hypothetical protein